MAEISSITSRVASRNVLSSSIIRKSMSVLLVARITQTREADSKNGALAGNGLAGDIAIHCACQFTDNAEAEAGGRLAACRAGGKTSETAEHASFILWK